MALNCLFILQSSTKPQKDMKTHRKALFPAESLSVRISTLQNEPPFTSNFPFHKQKALIPTPAVGNGNLDCSISMDAWSAIGKLKFTLKAI